MNLKPVLILSVAANIVLVGAAGYFAASRGKISNDLRSASLLSDKASRPTAKSVEKDSAAPTSSVITNRVVQKIDWRSVESEDYRKYIANLRSTGCPEETIRDIITADVNKLFAQRRRELATGGKKFEFWKTSGNPFAAMMDSDKLEKQQALDKEKRTLLRELLGVEPEMDKPNMFAGMFDTMLDFLPPEKQSKVMELMQDMQVKAMKSMGKGGQPDGEDMKQIQKMQKEMEAELAKIMTPQEFEDYQLRMSQTAMTMRMQLASFDPNEDEFRKIFAEKKKFDDDFSMFTAGTEDKVERDKRKAAQDEMNKQLKSILGDDRYAEYERAQDWNYQNIYRIADRNGLGKDGANKVYDMKKVAEDEAKKIRDNKSLTSEQRTAALNGIRTETENSIHAVFGDKGWKSYENLAYWLNNISPKPKTEPSGATAQ